MIIGINGKIGSGKDTVGIIIQWLTSNGKPYNVDTLAKVLKDKSYHPLNKINSSFEIKKFADKLKDIVCLLINCTREQLEDAEFKNKELGEEWWYYKPSDTMYPYLEFKQHEDQHHGIAIYKEDLIKLTPRLLLQLLGTDCGRDIIHPNIWTNSLMNEYKSNITLNEDTKDIWFKENGYNYKLLRKEDSILYRKIKLSYIKYLNNTYPNWVITDMRFTNELGAVKSKGGISIRVNRHWIDKKKEHQLIKEHESEIALDNATFDYTIDNNGTIEDLIEKVKEILIKEQII